MASTVLAVNTNIQQSLTGNDQLVVLEGVVLTAGAITQNGINISGNNNFVTILGTVVGLDFPTIFHNNASTGDSIYIGPNGNIVNASEVFVAVTIGGEASIVSHGNIIGTTAVAMSNDSSFINYGTVHGTDDALGKGAVRLSGNQTVFTNYGDTTSSGVGVLSEGGNQNRVINFGTISAESAVAATGGANFTLINHGTITSDDGIAIQSLRNGTLIKNLGLVQGNVGLSGTGTTFVNAGEVVGNIGFVVDGGLYRGTADSVLDGILLGGLGADTVLGGGNGDSIQGGTNDDVLRGRGGDDTIDGGNDDDLIEGGSGNDTLSGGAGRDTILGGSGDDSIDGGGGVDVINGGAGDDTLTGSLGPDIFVLDRNAGNDVITDFQDGVDDIDLSAMDANNRAAVAAAGAFSQQGADVVIDLSLIGGNGTLTVQNTLIQDLGAADFIF